MLLLVDMGNTDIVIGITRTNEYKILNQLRFPTMRLWSKTDYESKLKMIFDEWDIKKNPIKACVMSSTVPKVTTILKEAIEATLQIDVLNITGESDKYISTIRSNPETIGADLIVGAVAAKEMYGYPSIIIDMGTCTTISAVNSKGEYIGGTIMPGLSTQLNALIQNAPHLPSTAFDIPKSTIGVYTKEAIQSGIMYGHIGAINGIVENMQKELLADSKIIITGGLSSYIKDNLKFECIHDTDLLFKGMYIIYKK